MCRSSDRVEGGLRLEGHAAGDVSDGDARVTLDVPLSEQLAHDLHGTVHVGPVVECEREAPGVVVALDVSAGAETDPDRLDVLRLEDFVHGGVEGIRLNSLAVGRGRLASGQAAAFRATHDDGAAAFGALDADVVALGASFGGKGNDPLALSRRVERG